MFGASKKKHRSNPSNYSILFQILLKICSIEVLGDKTRNQPTSNDIRWQEAHVELIFLTIVTQLSISVPCIERTTSVGASHLIGHIISLYIIWYTLIHTVSYHIYVVTYNMVKQVTSLSSTNQELMRQVENPCSAKMQKGKWPMTGGSQDVTIMKKNYINMYQPLSTIHAGNNGNNIALDYCHGQFWNLSWYPPVSAQLAGTSRSSFEDPNKKSSISRGAGPRFLKTPS